MLRLHFVLIITITIIVQPVASYALWGDSAPAAPAPTEGALTEKSEHKDVPYRDDSGDEQQMLDIYLPQPIEEPENAALPVHVFVHGGGWNIGDKKSVDAKEASAYTKEGVIVVSINYRLSPTHRHPAHVEDCAAAMKWIVDNIKDYGGDPNNITLSGHSSGAHLVALLATHPDYLAEQELSRAMFRGIIAVDTASFNLTNPAERRLIERWTTNAFGTSLVTRRDASPVAHAHTKGSLSPILVYVTAERPSAVEESRDFTARLLAHGHDATLSVLDRELSHADMKHLIFTNGTEIHTAIMSLGR